MRLFSALILGVMLLFGGVYGAAAQEAAPVAQLGDPSPNDLRELMRLLADDKVRNWLQKSALAEGAMDATQENVTLRHQLDAGLNSVRSRLNALGQAWAVLPEAPQILAERWQSEMKLHRKIRSLTFLVVFLFVGAGLEWLYRQYTRIPLLRLSMVSHSAPSKRALAALIRAAIITVGVLLFAIGSVGTFLSFEWPPLMETLVLNFLIVVIAVRAIRALTMFILAPRVPDLRMVPVSNRMAKHLHFSFTVIATAIGLSAAVSELFVWLTAESAGAGAEAALAVSVTLGGGVVALAFALIWSSFRLWHQEKELSNSHSNWQVYLYAVTTVVFFLWLIGARNLMWSGLVLATLLPLLWLLRGWVNHFFDQAGAALRQANAIMAEETEPPLGEVDPTVAPAEPPPPTPAQPEPYSTLRLLSQRLVRFITIIIAVILLANIWGGGILSLSQSKSTTGQVFGVLVDATFVILVADLIWAWARSAIDNRLAAYVPPEGSEAPGPEARMATLLPLLRMTLLVGLLVMVVFSILSSLGVNIAPLIAGAGVLGIAIGFGAQSLVRDVVSGIFFLIDDAFRLGEYIEIGELRGTVESISIRSLRVRHHRGAIHTIPFGELKFLTNHSRDWVIMKLEFRVPFETDLKLVKKLVKKVGAELEQNEFYGPSILQTLKSQGVRRMEEFNMVVGVKFMTKPGEQWLVRRDAYQMVRDAFDANGIRMAERNVKVEIQGGEELSESEKQAVAGAAQLAAEGPGGPPKPVPDEP